MKKISLLLLLASFSGFAQFSFGPKAGLLVSNVKSEISSGGPAKTSFYAAGFFEYKFSKFALNWELNYADAGSKGKEYDYYNGDLTGTYKRLVHVSMLSVYVHGKYYLTDDLALFAGGYFGTILSVKAKSNGHSDDLTDYYTPIDFGLSAGAEYTFYKKMFVEVRYSLGLHNINNQKPTAVYVDDFDPAISNPSGVYLPALKNRQFMVGLGYKF